MAQKKNRILYKLSLLPEHNSINCGNIHFNEHMLYCLKYGHMFKTMIKKLTWIRKAMPQIS